MRTPSTAPDKGDDFDDVVLVERSRFMLLSGHDLPINLHSRRLPRQAKPIDQLADIASVDFPKFTVERQSHIAK